MARRRKKTNKPDERPSFQFYPKDWLAEAGLRFCNLSARGLWIELLCHMWRLHPRGTIRPSKSEQKLNKQTTPSASKPKQPCQQTISKLVGRPVAEVRAALKQLIEYEVCGTTDDGGIYSRRMVRDESIRQARIRAGRKGGQSRGRAKGQAKRGSPSPSPSPSPSATPPLTDKESCTVTGSVTPPAQVPDLIKGLELFEKDPDLVRRWEILHARWADAYPGIDLAQEIKNAHIWQLSDPRRRKVKQAKFLTNWFRKAQEGASRGVRSESPRPGSWAESLEEQRRRQGVD